MCFSLLDVLGILTDLSKLSERKPEALVHFQVDPF